MIMTVYKNNEGIPELLGNVKIKGTISGTKKLIDVLDNELKLFLEGVLGEPVKGTGLKQIHSCGDFWSSFKIREGVPKDIIRMHGFSECCIVSKDETEFGDISLDWSDSSCVDMGGDFGDSLTVGIDVYDPGYVIASSAVGFNVLGSRSKMFFKGISRKTFKQQSRSGARVFANETAAQKYIREHLNTFKFMNMQYGYEFRLEPASGFWEHVPKPEVMRDLEVLFADINDSGLDEPEIDVKDDVKDNAVDEAVSRMKELQLYDGIIKDFINDGKVYMSEFGGILFDLNEHAENAVKETISRGGLPYHVVRSQTKIGDMYAVLFVSKFKDEWYMEHLRMGLIVSRVFNYTSEDPEGLLVETGSVGLVMANGGLVRTC